MIPDRWTCFRETQRLPRSCPRTRFVCVMIPDSRTELTTLPHTQALAFLKSDELKEKVKAGILKAQQRGISGVPFTILNDKLAISGGALFPVAGRAQLTYCPRLAAQETETFLDVFKRIASGELKA